MNVKIFNSRRTILFLSHQSDSKNKNFFANSLPSLLKIHTHTNIQANYGETGSLVILNTESIYPRSLQFGRNVHRFSFSPSKKKLIAKGQIKRVSTRKEMERNGGKGRKEGEKENLSLSLSLSDAKLRRRMALGWKSLLFSFHPHLVFPVFLLFFSNATEKAHAVMKT